MSNLRNVNLDRAIARVADNVIREAMEQGKFDRLEGAGEPIECVSEPYHDNWWIRRWIQRERLRQMKQDSGATAPTNSTATRTA